MGFDFSRGLCGGLFGLGTLKEEVNFFPQETLRRVLDTKPSSLLVKERFEFVYKNQRFLAKTTINQGLQGYLESMLSDALGAKTAIVCLDPISGKVLAMAGFDRKRPDSHIWTDELVPSASLFKIVTAAAAMEFFQIRPYSVFSFNGGKHTLYKFQLRDRHTKYTNSVTLKEAFAQSINPVFGKIGKKYLKKGLLLKMARRFLWQKDIPFELSIKKSQIVVEDREFNWAEIASGFNKKTKLTAMHEALMAAGITNSGIVMAPNMIDSILNLDTGKVVYESKFYPLIRSINPKTSSFLKEMMVSTIKKGTAKRAFRHYRRDKVLKNLVMGGKTGTIDNLDHTIRYDLFCGFACTKDETRCISVGIFVAHERVLGQRAAEFARLIFKRYFQLEGIREGKGKR